MGRGCLGCDGAAAVVAGAGEDVTWSAGSDSGTVCKVGRIVVDIFQDNITQAIQNSLLASSAVAHSTLSTGLSPKS